MSLFVSAMDKVFRAISSSRVITSCGKHKSSLGGKDNFSHRECCQAAPERYDCESQSVELVMLQLPGFVVDNDVTRDRQEGKHHELLMKIYCLNRGIRRISQESYQICLVQSCYFKENTQRQQQLR